MSKGASRSINYSLRPAKNIERKMMGEALARLSPIAPLSRYRYVGFGSEFFNDFALYHQMLGIEDMVSIERNEEKLERCRFNRPYKCVDVRGGSSRSILPQLSWKNKRSIVWLDYTDPLDSDILDDVRFVLTAASSGSVLIVTANAHPLNAQEDDDGATRGAAAELPKKRLDKLISRVGSDRVPSELTGVQLAQWGLAEVSYRILLSDIQETLNDRNAPEKKQAKLRFRQFLHFRYRDGQRMFTVGGIIIDPKDDSRLGEDGFEGLAFVRTGEPALLIDPPMLTGREVRHLNQSLPHEAGELSHPHWLPAEDRRRYKDVYRYFPVFAESEL